jgi:transcription elongation factor Elf1
MSKNYKKNNHRCEIRVNENITEFRCPYCTNKDALDASYPIAIFDKETNMPVCYDCAQKYNPTALKAMQAVNTTITYGYSPDVYRKEAEEKYITFFAKSVLPLLMDGKLQLVGNNSFCADDDLPF